MTVLSSRLKHEREIGGLLQLRGVVWTDIECVLQYVGRDGFEKLVHEESAGVLRVQAGVCDQRTAAAVPPPVQHAAREDGGVTGHQRVGAHDTVGSDKCHRGLTLEDSEELRGTARTTQNEMQHG